MSRLRVGDPVRSARTGYGAGSSPVTWVATTYVPGPALDRAGRETVRCRRLRCTYSRPGWLRRSRPSTQSASASRTVRYARGTCCSPLTAPIRTRRHRGCPASTCPVPGCTGRSAGVAWAWPVAARGGGDAPYIRDHTPAHCPKMLDSCQLDVPLLMTSPTHANPTSTLGQRRTDYSSAPLSVRLAVPDRGFPA
jgi:hypothetical protein